MAMRDAHMNEPRKSRVRCVLKEELKTWGVVAAVITTWGGLSWIFSW